MEAKVYLEDGTSIIVSLKELYSGKYVRFYEIKYIEPFDGYFQQYGKYEIDNIDVWKLFLKNEKNVVLDKGINYIIARSDNINLYSFFKNKGIGYFEDIVVLCCRYNSINLIEEIIKNNFVKLKKINEDQSLLSWALEYGSIDVARCLIANGIKEIVEGESRLDSVVYQTILYGYVDCFLLAMNFKKEISRSLMFTIITALRANGANDLIDLVFSLPMIKKTIKKLKDEDMLSVCVAVCESDIHLRHAIEFAGE